MARTREKTYIAAAGNARAIPGVLKRIIVIAPGSAGNLTVWDANDAGGQIDTNRVMLRAFGGMAAGDNMAFDCPMDTGIRLGITTGGIFLVVHGDRE